MTKRALTGVIMASGEGSRMSYMRALTGLPKHLLPIGSSTPVSRIAKELSVFCEEVLCIVPLGLKSVFYEEFKRRELDVKVYEKEERGFRGDFIKACEKANFSNIILTVGDIVFPDGEISSFIERAEDTPDKIVIALDRRRLRILKLPTILDFRMVLASVPKDLLFEYRNINPESILSMFNIILRFITKNRIRFLLSNVLFNINTPSEYYRAKHHLQGCHER
ncbi:MAG: hypothetical protein D6828_00240 [Nitrospirae bacterium]|nr:MAG: hypothetical protein D6828_00240 [Nitrospirota bacterium]